MYDDQKWRENVFQPWQEGVSDQWRMDREKADKWNRENKSPGSYFMGVDRQNFGPPRYRSAGRIGSRGGGGGMGGGSIDPALLDALMSGG
jgi:hypothetical protein